MEKIARLYNKIFKNIDNLSFADIDSHLSLIGVGQIMEIFEMSDHDNGYYKWLHAYVETKKPKQVVELGAAAGISTLLMATANPESKIISVDCDTAAWRWMNREYPNVIKVYGDDLDLSIYPKDIDLFKTDFWFIDTLHTGTQLKEELKTYKKFFKKGAVIAFDDIHVNKGMEEVWNELPYEKLDVSARLHYTGFGIAII